MPVGSLPAVNLLEKKESASEKGGLMSGLWEQASGRKVDGDRSRGKGGRLVPHLWDTATGKKDKDNRFSLFGGTSSGKKKSSIDWGPGGAIGSDVVLESVLASQVSTLTLLLSLGFGHCCQVHLCAV